MEDVSKRNSVWIYILVAILAFLGIIGLVRGDWISSGYVLGAVGIVVWIYGTRRRREVITRLGLILAGLGVGILLYDMARDLLA